jgi:pyrroline-5-carboxylate reductase
LARLKRAATAVTSHAVVLCGMRPQDTVSALETPRWLSLQAAAGSDAHLIRVMPNTPCLVGESASAMCLGGKANEKDGEDVHTLFAAVGKIFKVSSHLERGICAQ